MGASSNKQQRRGIAEGKPPQRTKAGTIRAI
jgi:hypothetical protein